MSSSLESSESEQGLSLLLHSGGESPTDFTNVLNRPIKLGPGDWEVGLANLHIPTYQQTLEKMIMPDHILVTTWECLHTTILMGNGNLLKILIENFGK